MGEFESGSRAVVEKLQVNCNVISCWKSGIVTIPKLENEEMKKEIMWNKNKLREMSIYIENDLSWEDRKMQENINKWVKEKRAKGEDIKVGYGKVKIKGIWKNWLEIMKEKGKRGKIEKGWG